MSGLKPELQTQPRLPAGSRQKTPLLPAHLPQQADERQHLPRADQPPLGLAAFRQRLFLRQKAIVFLFHGFFPPILPPFFSPQVILAENYIFSAAFCTKPGASIRRGHRGPAKVLLGSSQCSMGVLVALYSVRPAVAQRRSPNLRIGFARSSPRNPCGQHTPPFSIKHAALPACSRKRGRSHQVSAMPPLSHE